MKYLLLFILSFSPLFAYDWTTLYNGNHEIYDFSYCQTGLNQYALACEDGLLIYDGSTWNQASYGLPVWNILPWIDQQFLLIQGNGSYSDGVYKFNEYTQQYEIIEWIYYPNFLVFNEEQQEYYIGANQGLYQSGDGQSWQEVTYFSGRNCLDMVFWENHYAVSVSDNIPGVYYSADYGLNWNAPVSGCPYIQDMEFTSTGILYGIFPNNSNASGLWNSTDFGANWNWEAGSLYCKTVNVDVMQIIFVGWEINNGVAKWEGNHFTYMNDGLPCLDINKLCVNPAMSSIHLIALTDNGAYILTNFMSNDPVLSHPEIQLSNYPNPFNPSHNDSI